MTVLRAGQLQSTVDDKKSLELRLENLTAELSKGKGLLAEQEASKSGTAGKARAGVFGRSGVVIRTMQHCIRAHNCACSASYAFNGQPSALR